MGGGWCGGFCLRCWFASGVPHVGNVDGLSILIYAVYQLIVLMYNEAAVAVLSSFQQGFDGADAGLLFQQVQRRHKAVVQLLGRGSSEMTFPVGIYAVYALGCGFLYDYLHIFHRCLFRV